MKNKEIVDCIKNCEEEGTIVETLKSQIDELNKKIDELVEKNADDKLIGSLELKREELTKKLKESSKPQKPLTTKEKLLKLVTDRVKTQHALYNITTQLKQEEQKLVNRQHELKIILDEMAASDNPDTKKRFSNGEKRKFEFELLYNNDPQILKIVPEIQKLSMELYRLECVDKIQKIDEKYLFKLIEIELKTMDLKV